MSNDDKKLENEARNWAIALTDEDIDGKTLREFQAWRNQDPRHFEAFERADKVWRGIGQLQHLRRYAVLPEKQTVWAQLKAWWQGGEYRMAVGGFGFAAVAAVAVIALAPVFSGYETYSTAVAQTESFQLQDGTTVTLGAKSKIKVQYSEHLRKVELIEGDALFEVTHNTAQPFVVLTEQTETRVLGTVFTVERDSEEVRIAVKQGKVRVGSPLPMLATQLDDGGARVITLGQGVTADMNGSASEIMQVDIDTIGSWTQGRITYENATLRTIIEDANRYSRKTIHIADEATAQMRVSIAFRTDNVDQMIENLIQILDLEKKQNLLGNIILQKRST